VGVVTWFKRRRDTDQLSPEGVRCRARTSARIAGCGRAEILAVDSYAIDALKSGESNHEVLERCATIARALVEQRRTASV
jgi:hypothetical protein